jgi:hypothetical protein
MDQTEWSYLHQRRFDLRLRARMNRLYQQRRQAVMELREGAVKVASLIAGSVALANVANPVTVQIAAAVIFAGTAAALVFGWGSKARDAARRHGDWTAIEREIDAAGERRFSEADLDRWASRCNEVEASEPAPNRFMIERAYRTACTSLGATPTAGGPWPWVPGLVVP